MIIFSRTCRCQSDVYAYGLSFIEREKTKQSNISKINLAISEKLIKALLTHL